MTLNERGGRLLVELSEPPSHFPALLDHLNHRDRSQMSSSSHPVLFRPGDGKYTHKWLACCFVADILLTSQRENNDINTMRLHASFSQMPDRHEILKAFSTDGHQIASRAR